MSPNELKHYGILGMKWGIRRTPKQLGHRTSSTRKNNSESEEDLKTKKERILNSHSAATIYANKDILSDAEIQSAVNRLNNETRIKDLIPETKSSGKHFINSSINMAKKTSELLNNAYNLYNSYKKVKTVIQQINQKTTD